jgi:phosphoribosylaminoimidazolecarboxamide formyltransferase/IMP cyclohydrolase
VNLYPFQDNLNIDEMIELIDIGGVSLLRAAAKNFDYVASVCNVSQYEKLIENLEQNEGETSSMFRKELAVQVFAHTSQYDAKISNALSEVLLPQQDVLPEIINISFNKECDLRYGENPHQKAAFYSNKTNFEILNGKELSFNNINDISAALDIISEFPDVPAVSIIKHATPCGVALGETIAEAYFKSFDCDPMSAFGGIIAFNQTVTKEIAKHAGSVFLEVLVAPDLMMRLLKF